VIAAVLAFLGGIIPAAVKAWFGARKAPEIAESEKAGAAEQAAADAQAQAKASAEAARAAIQAPDTSDEVADRMNAGTF
jgi:hypothetical protein